MVGELLGRGLIGGGGRERKKIVPYVIWALGIIYDLTSVFK